MNESKTERMKTTAQIRKKRRRRRDAAVSAVLILAVICICLVVVYCTDMFTVRSVVLNSDGERYSDADLLSASGISTGDRLFLIHMNEAEKQIVTTLPYIRTAKVSRNIDGTVTVDVQYGKAAFCISGMSGYVYIDPDGKVLENNALMPAEGSAELSGISLISAAPGYPVDVAEKDLLGDVMEAAALFAESGIDKITLYDYTDPSNVRMELDYRIIVKIGTVNKIKNKLPLLREALSDALKNPPNGGRVVFELIGGAWTARNESSIEEAYRKAHERLNAPQPATDREGNTVEASSEATTVQEQYFG